MPILDASTSCLVLIDLQARLMPVIDEAASVIAQVRRLVAAAALLDVPVLATEQNPARLGATVPDVGLTGVAIAKMTFDATPTLVAALPTDATVVIVGCEAHVCVLQTVLGLLARGRRVAVAQDAIGSRLTSNREAAIRRMGRHGAEIVTVEMVVFEWIGGCEHPRFRDALALIR